jgi:hypothetical protein
MLGHAGVLVLLFSISTRYAVIWFYFQIYKPCGDQDDEIKNLKYM